MGHKMVKAQNRTAPQIGPLSCETKMMAWGRASFEGGAAHTLYYAVLDTCPGQHTIYSTGAPVA
jgi:hypothetical protein